MEKLFSVFNKTTRPFKGKFLGKIPGVASLYRLLYRTMRPKGMILIDVQGIKLYVDTRDQGIVPFLLTQKVFEEFETELFRTLIKPSMTVVDIGANFGYYTCLAANLVGNKGKVFAFEPEPKNYEMLLRNIDLNQHQNVIPIQKAVSNKVGKTKLFLDRNNFGAPSLSEGNIISRRGFIEVETLTLDTFFDGPNMNRPDFIKIDAQGGEGLIIDGAKHVLQNSPLKLIIEFWPYGLLQMGQEPLRLINDLINYGFSIQRINGKTHSFTQLNELKFQVNIKKKRSLFFNLFLEK
jgi:FkbM family methyltransferase